MKDIVVQEAVPYSQKKDGTINYTSPMAGLRGGCFGGLQVTLAADLKLQAAHTQHRISMQGSSKNGNVHMCYYIIDAHQDLSTLKKNYTFT